jgi:hypothetical protein
MSEMEKINNETRFNAVACIIFSPAYLNRRN